MALVLSMASMLLALVSRMVPVSMLLALVSRMATMFLMRSTARVSRPSRVMESGVRKPGPGDHLHHTQVTLASWRDDGVDGLQLSHRFLHCGI